MYTYSLSQWVLFFLVYCFAGWCIESSFVSWRQRRLVNRGFLYGPVIPIYGFGAIAILFATLPVRRWPVAVFLLGMLAATALEYVTGAVMEAIFKVRYWDYSQKPLNLHGYICLNTSLAWGVLSIVLVLWLHRPVEALILGLPRRLAQGLSLGLLGLFLADFALSVRAALDLRQMLEQLSRYAESAHQEAQRLQKRLEVASVLRREALLEKLPDGGEALLRRVEAMEEAAARLEQSEAAVRLRTELAAWRAHRAATREALRQRLTWDKRTKLHNSPSASSRRYARQLQLLRERLDEQEKHETEE